MAVNEFFFNEITRELLAKNITLVAVSKTKPPEDIRQLYALGQRDFGENYVQEITDKQALLPQDINWHFIGHLQTNKVKYLAPFVYMIHSVDSLKLLIEINKQAVKNSRVIPVLLQVHIAMEETKFGLDGDELKAIMQALPGLRNVSVKGLMGMASFTDNENTVRKEYSGLKTQYDDIKATYAPHIQQLQFTTLSMGMSADYHIAIEEGSNMVRIGSLLFGERIKKQ